MYGDDRRAIIYTRAAWSPSGADAGKLKWHYQFTLPHDVHIGIRSATRFTDGPESRWPGEGRRDGGRNGFFLRVVTSVETQQIAKPYTKVSWAEGIGTDGRPKLIQGRDPTDEGNKSCPGLGRAQLWRATTTTWPPDRLLSPKLPPTDSASLLQDQTGLCRGPMVSGQHCRRTRAEPSTRIDRGGRSLDR